MSQALEMWRRKLDYFQQQEAIVADPGQKFALAEQIEEAKAKIAELETTAGSQQSRATTRLPRDSNWYLMTAAESQQSIATTVREAEVARSVLPARPQAHQSESEGASTPRDLVYISYSHKDKPWHRKLRRILDADPDIRDRVWDDTKIRASADFAKEINQHVARARVMIILGSQHYFALNSGAARCETRPALEAHRDGELDILWFPVAAHSFSSSPVGHLMAATGVGAVPLEQLPPAEQNKALRKVHQEVRGCLGLAATDNHGSQKQRLVPAPEKLSKVISAHPHQRGRNPQPQLTVESAQPKRTTNMQPPADFVIITPLEEEREAMLAHLGNCTRVPPTHDDIRVYYAANVPVTFTDGSSANYKVVHTDLLGMGRVEAANAVGDAIRRWRPRYILLVGIAGGLAKAGVNIGDVLISEQIADYEVQKVTSDKAHIRWSVHRADPRLLAAAKQLRPEEWRPLIRESRPQPGQSQRHAGPICTGDKVVANGLMDQYRDVWTKLIGVEMEAGGVASAAFQAANAPGFFMVRGVSDLADAEKDKSQTHSWRIYACDVAAAYVLAFLRSGPIPANPK